jgi:hypothetical protein
VHGFDPLQEFHFFLLINFFLANFEFLERGYRVDLFYINLFCFCCYALRCLLRIGQMKKDQV